MANKILCITVRSKCKDASSHKTLVSKKIGRFSEKLTLEDICNEVIGDDIELSPSINKVLIIMDTVICRV